MMKKILVLTGILPWMILNCVLFGQAPQSFKYQMVVRDAAGELLQNQNVNLRFNIHDLNASGVVVYSETHSVITNQFGLATLNIGDGIPIAGDFSVINWGVNEKFLEVELDMGVGYASMGTSQLLSVPFALYSENTANIDDADADPSNELQIISKAGNTVSLSGGGGSFIDETDDDDPDPLNELQNLSIAGNELSISNGNTITLPSSGTGSRISDADGDTWIDAERNADNDSIVFTTFGMERMVISNNGYVEVNGQMIATGFQGDGSGLTGVPGDDLGDHTAIQELDMANHRIINVVSPIDANDAATKLYVDTQISFTGDNLGDHTATQNIELNGFRISNDGDNEGISLDNDGHVGINTLSPDQRLTVDGNIRAEEQVMAGFGASDNPTFRFGSGYESTGLASPYVNSVALITDGTERLTVRQNGNIGIGVTNPQAPLHINGFIRMVDGNQGPGKILTSDAVGNSSWQNPVLSDSDWHISGDDMYSEVSGNVGIGTVTPGATLDVGGHIWQSGTGQSVFIGEGAGENDNLLNNSNVFVGYEAGNSNIDGVFNVAIGHSSLNSNTGGLYNTAVGTMTLYSNDGGSRNTASGFQAMRSNTSGNNNTAYGYESMESNTEGEDNTANGYNSLFSNSEGAGNCAIGYRALFSNTLGNNNTAVGKNALYSNQTGFSNIAIGPSAMNNNQFGSNIVAIGDSALYSISSSANFNTAIGSKTLFSNSHGDDNTAVGYQTLFANTSGNENTALGSKVLASNTSGDNNSAFGFESLSSSTTGNDNTALGHSVLFENINGYNNTGTGSHALYSNTSGSYNTAMGISALGTNTIGTDNTAIGAYAAFENWWGNRNTSVGAFSLYNNSHGDYNVATGFEALYSNTGGLQNSAHGYEALHSNTTGDYNSAFGYSAFSDGTDFNNATGLGYNAEPGGSNRIAIGNTSVTWIGGQVNWSTYSDANAKTDIREDVKGLDFILNLRPVTYRFDKDKMDQLIGTVDSSDYSNKYEVERIRRSGFLAQEVENAAKKSGYDFSGVNKLDGEKNYYSLAYAEFVVPLVKAVQELAVLNEKLTEQLNGQQEIIIEQSKRIEILEKTFKKTNK